MDAEKWLDAYQHRAQDIGRRAAAAQAELAAVAVTETSPDGSVTLTVNPAGALQALTLGPPAEGLSRVQLAAAIVTTARRAQGVAARRAAEVMRPLLGERSAAMTMLRAQIPEPQTPGPQTPGSELDASASRSAR